MRGPQWDFCDSQLVAQRTTKQCRGKRGRPLSQCLKQESLMRHFGINEEHKHRALADCEHLQLRSRPQVLAAEKQDVRLHAPAMRRRRSTSHGGPPFAQAIAPRGNDSSKRGLARRGGVAPRQRERRRCRHACLQPGGGGGDDPSERRPIDEVLQGTSRVRVGHQDRSIPCAAEMALKARRHMKNSPNGDHEEPSSPERAPANQTGCAPQSITSMRFDCRKIFVNLNAITIDPRVSIACKKMCKHFCGEFDRSA